MDIFYTKFLKNTLEECKHSLIFHLLDHYINKWVLFYDSFKSFPEFFHNNLLTMEFVKFAHIHSIKFYRIYFTEIINTDHIMIPNRMKIINGDLVPSSSKSRENFIEIHIIIDEFRLEYFKYYRGRIYIISSLQ